MVANLPSLRTSSDADNQPSVLINNIEFTKNNNFLLFGYEIDVISFSSIVVMLAVFNLFWFRFGFFRSMKKNKYLLSVYVFSTIFLLIQIGSSESVSGSISYETGKLSDIDQQISTFTSEYILFLFLLFYVFSMADEKYLLILLLLFIAHLYPSVPQTGKATRIVRKVKQYLFNICVMLIIGVLVSFVKN